MEAANQFNLWLKKIAIGASNLFIPVSNVANCPLLVVQGVRPRPRSQLRLLVVRRSPPLLPLLAVCRPLASHPLFAVAIALSPVVCCSPFAIAFVNCRGSTGRTLHSPSSTGLGAFGFESVSRSQAFVDLNLHSSYPVALLGSMGCRFAGDYLIVWPGKCRVPSGCLYGSATSSAADHNQHIDESCNPNFHSICKNKFPIHPSFINNAPLICGGRDDEQRERDDPNLIQMNLSDDMLHMVLFLRPFGSL